MAVEACSLRSCLLTTPLTAAPRRTHEHADGPRATPPTTATTGRRCMGELRVRTFRATAWSVHSHAGSGMPPAPPEHRLPCFAFLPGSSQVPNDGHRLCGQLHRQVPRTDHAGKGWAVGAEQRHAAQRGPFPQWLTRQGQRLWHSSAPVCLHPRHAGGASDAGERRGIARAKATSRDSGAAAGAWRAAVRPGLVPAAQCPGHPQRPVAAARLSFKP
jgi:hypothetical protein